MLKIGSLVESKKGHDSKRVYVIVKLQDEFAFAVDGKFRTLDKPKKKRLKHLLNLHFEMPEVLEKLKENKLFDFEIATFIKNSKSKFKR